MNRLLFLIFLIATLNAFSIKARYSIKARANVTDIVYSKPNLYIATDIGVIQVYNTKSKSFTKEINIPYYLDFMGDTVHPKIYDIDYNKENKELSIVAQTEGGFSDVFIYRNNQPIKIINKNNRYMIKKAIYLDGSDLLLGLLSNEIIRYNIKNRKVVYKTQISAYTFSDFCLSQKAGRIISADESGRVNIISSKDGKVILIHEGENLDNVYRIDYKGNCIATAGQDRRLGIYLFNPFSSYHIQSEFLIYAVALSPSGKKVAYLCDEDNDITIINTQSKEELAKLVGHSAIINTIQFIDEHAIFTSADEPIINYWEF